MLDVSGVVIESCPVEVFRMVDYLRMQPLKFVSGLASVYSDVKDGVQMDA